MRRRGLIALIACLACTPGAGMAECAPATGTALGLLEDLSTQAATVPDGGDAVLLEPLADPDTRAVIDAARAELAALDCAAAPSADPPPTTWVQRVTAKSTQELIRAIVWLTIGAVSAFVATTIYWLRRQQDDLMRRRAQRFPLNRPAPYLFLGDNHSGRLLDISSMGAQIEHGGVLAGAVKSRITIVLAGWPQEAIVAWSNGNFAGIEFTKPLARSRLHNFITQGSDSPGTPEKAA